MSRVNLYVHYDSVSSHVMTRGIDLLPADFEAQFIPQNIILSQASSEFGKLDVRTNFKIIRGRQEVLEYMNHCQKMHIRMSQWIDFESITMMQQLTPTEISEILYLFHANQTLRSAFFYKLQNNYAFLTLQNGLVKTYYRYPQHFMPRLHRVLKAQVQQLINENKTLFFSKKEYVVDIPEDILVKFNPLFTRGLKIDLAQAFQVNSRWEVPLFIIEDELTLLMTNQTQNEQIGILSYDTKEQIWEFDLVK